MQRYFARTVPFPEREAVNAITQCAYPVRSVEEPDPLFERIGDARIVMPGESLHGAQEYYTWISQITKRFIEEKRFDCNATKGKLARPEYPAEDVVPVGLGTYTRTVPAGRRRGAPMKKMIVPPAVKDSWERLLHAAGKENKLLLMEDFTGDLFMENHIGHRANGVLYDPQPGQYGNYVPGIMPLRYGSLVWLDETRALHPLHIVPDGHQVPETFPFGV